MSPQKRLWIVGGLLAVGCLALVIRLIDLSLINRHFLQTQFSERTIREVPIPAYRGIIRDRNGEPLAISTPVYSVWVNPKELDLTDTQLKDLAKLLDMPLSKINNLLEKNKTKQFVYLKRNLPPELANQIRQLNIHGLAFEKNYRRYYPGGEANAQLIGFTNIDDQGQEGIELEYNQYLQGQPGIKKVLKDRYGNVVTDMGVIKEAIPGKDLTLSIDSRLQYVAYNELVNGINTFGAQSGSIVILNIHTGEILAMANAPSFNPNARQPQVNGNYRNRAITDLFEPGSSIKTFAMTTAIGTGKVTPNTLVNTHPGYWYVDGKRVEDDDHIDNGVIDMTRVLEVSSNVGISKIMLGIPPSLLLNLLTNLGFSQPTGIGYPGEANGYITKKMLSSSFVYATTTFGYGLSVNLLQLAHAYATLGNNGVKIPLSLLKLDQPPAPNQESQVIDPKTASTILTMLENVLKKGGGTATRAQIPDYRVTGKTGTTRLLGPHGYEKDHHNSSFVGIAPATRPELVVAIFLHDPTKKAFYGGAVAGPVFYKVMSESLRILNVPPDDIQPQH